MNRLVLYASACLLGTASFISAQTPPADTRSQEQLAALIKEVRDQQTALTENQAKIDEKLAALAEAIRQARIYSSRAGR
jgi:hypothetical protein